MAKETKVKDYKEEAEKLNKPTNKEVLESLKVQLEQHTNQANYHKEMALKAQGAIEVLMQMEGINESERDGGTGSTASSE